ncbi:MAG: carboxypeptidase-like regulatory domain-containing protein [Terracidiphilus sp.]
MRRRKLVIWIVAGVVVAAVTITLVLRQRHWQPGTMTIQGAVIRRDSDTRKQMPISGAQVTASDGVTSASTESDASGFFKLRIPGVAWPGRTVNLAFRRVDYQPLDLQLQGRLNISGRELYVAAMTPNREQTSTVSGSPESVISNIRIRYTVNSQTEENIGSAVRTFQVVNHGNQACNGQSPCSPDGRWKASTDSLSLDAGPGNEFRDVRVSCIAGPCPFTQIDSSGFANGGRNITVSALAWSETTTFLLEAEVFHTAIRSNVRQSYPVIFGRALNFTVPPTQEGVSIEADMDGTPMVFPLGPELYLSWATCMTRTSRQEEKSTLYLCELKPGYRF